MRLIVKHIKIPTRFASREDNGGGNLQTMNRRKPDSVMQNKREGLPQKGGNQKGLFKSQFSLFGGSTKSEDASGTAGTEPTSATGSVMDFDLPNWEKPQDAVIKEKYEKLPIKLPQFQQPENGIGYMMPKQIRQEPPVRMQQVEPQPQNNLCAEPFDELTDMVVTCNDSFNSINDDITFVSTSCAGEDEYDRARRYNQYNRKPDPPEIGPLSPMKSPIKASKDRMSFERNHNRYSSSPRRKPHSAPSMPPVEELSLREPSSPKKNFIWKRGPNGRFVKVHLDEAVAPGSTNEIKRPPLSSETKDEEDARLQRMEEEMLNQALEMSRHGHEEVASLQGSLHGSCSAFSTAGPQLHGSSSVLSVATPRMHGGSPARTGAHVMSKSNHSRGGASTNSVASVQTELEGQEEALIRLAMERSMQDVTSSDWGKDSKPRASGSSSHNGRQTQKPIDRRAHYACSHRKEDRQVEEDNIRARQVLYLGGSSTHSDSRRPPASPRGKPPPSPSAKQPKKNFVWKKGPNNRYIKCPITMDQLDEERSMDEFALEEQDNSGGHAASSGEHVSRMEEAMLEEAMKRSMRDLYAGM